ncbi:MAG: hypothetical protein ACJ8GN_21865 [Longimicrobiaceae bacterium]
MADERNHDRGEELSADELEGVSGGNLPANINCSQSCTTNINCSLSCGTEKA